MLQSVSRGAKGGARRLNTESHACFSAKNAAPSACVFHRAPTATSKFALVTTIGRPREEDPSALNL